MKRLRATRGSLVLGLHCLFSRSREAGGGAASVLVGHSYIIRALRDFVSFLCKVPSSTHTS